MPPDQPSPTDVLQALANLNRAMMSRKGAGKSNYPYYNSAAAEDVKQAVLIVLSKRAPMIWPARDVSEQTLYNKWKQGSDYLLNIYEPEFKPKHELVTATRIPKHGLRIAPVRLKSALNLLPEVEWRPDFTSFIDTAEHKDKFERVIPLSDEDIKWIHKQLEGVEHLFISDINDTGITIIRYDRK